MNIRTLVGVIVLIVAALALTACGAVGASGPPPAVAVTAQSIQLTLKQAYEAGQLAILDKAETREEFDKNVGAYRAKWKPVWEAYDVFADAYNGWVDAKTDPLKAFGQMRSAYCKLRDLAPGGVTLPNMPGPVACEGT